MAVVHYTDDQLRAFYNDESLIHPDNLVQINELVIGKYYIMCPVHHADTKFLVRYVGPDTRPTDGKILHGVKILMIGDPLERVLQNGIDSFARDDALIYNIPAVDAAAGGGGGYRRKKRGKSRKDRNSKSRKGRSSKARKRGRKSRKYQKQY